MSNMVSGNTLAEIAAAIGDPARANILTALMSGRALTATELAHVAGVTAQTTSGHLARLAEARLVAVEAQGRHRYHRLANPEVARALEALMEVAAHGAARHRPTGPRDAALRLARTCYDHLAGRLGVALADRLRADGRVILGDGVATVTEAGRRFFCDFGIELEPAGEGRRPLCRACLDWSERRPHLAGRLGAALLTRFDDLGWIARDAAGRAVRITPKGARGLAERFGVTAEDLEEGRDRARPLVAEGRLP